MFEKNIPEIGGGGPPFSGILKIVKNVKNMSPGLPRGALGDTFLTSWTPADRIQAVGGEGGGGYPPLAVQTDVKPALRDLQARPVALWL